MTTKRNDGELPVPLEGLAEERITRARAIKFAGATITAGALAFLLPDEADALTRKQRRRRRRRRAAARRRRQNNVTSDSSTVTFGDTVLNTPSPAENVTITNDGTTPVTLRPEVVGDGFTVAPTFPGIGGFTLVPGASIDVPVIFTPDVSGPSTGELRIVDAADGLLVETVELVGEGIL